MSEIPTYNQDGLEQFIIALKSLQKRSYDFQYTLTPAFFEHFEKSPIKEGNISVTLLLNKRSTVYHLSFQFDGVVNVACDRCLTLIDWPVLFEQEVVVKLVGGARMDNEDVLDIVYITPEHMQINVANLLYEFIILELPIKRTCDELDIPIACDEKVMAILEGRDSSDDDNTSSTDEEDIDPRWAMLKKLKKK